MQGKDVNGDIERLRAGQRQGLLPWSRERMTAVLNMEAEAAAKSGDAAKANWLLQRSLSLNSHQNDALRLRERIIGEREVWPTRSTVYDLFNGEIDRRFNSVPMPAPTQPYMNPFYSVPVPRERVPVGGSQSSAEPLAPGNLMDEAITAPAAEPSEPAPSPGGSAAAIRPGLGSLAPAASAASAVAAGPAPAPPAVLSGAPAPAGATNAGVPPAPAGTAQAAVIKTRVWPWMKVFAPPAPVPPAQSTPADTVAEAPPPAEQPK